MRLHPLHPSLASLLALTLFAGAVRAESSTVAIPPGLSWIWATGPGSDKAATLKKEIVLPAAPASAILLATCDNEAKVYVNGKLALTNFDWTQPAQADVSKLLKAGTNEIRVDAINHGGAMGFVATLTLRQTDGKEEVSGTDGTWLASLPGKDDFQPAHIIAPYGKGAWGLAFNRPHGGADGVAPKDATAAEAITAPPGFTVELLHTPSTSDEGSWVALCSDPKGRLIGSDQYGALYRVTPPPIGTATGSKVEKLPIEMGHANGLLWAFDSLYVMVCQEGVYGHGAGVYRVTFSKDGETPEKVEQVLKIDGQGDHGPHALVLTPDGKAIAILCGDGTRMPKMTKTQVPPIWSEDQVLPRMVGHGFMSKTGPPGGFVARMSPDGKELTLLAMGFRNPYDIAFNHEGELFTYDADMELEVGMPWYRPTRVCHVVDGADFGWRTCSGKQREYYGDTVPPTFNVGRGCPTGMAFGYDAKFPTRFREALFMCDWTYGKLYALYPHPQGASYTADIETFLEGRPLPLSDIVINPVDGAMYLTTGGRKGQSGLYRVSYHGAESTAPAPVATHDAGTEARQLRHELENLYGKQDSQATAQALANLENPDRFIRYSARTVLEFQPPSQWAEQALARTGTYSVIETSMALARLGELSRAPRIIANLAGLPLKKLTDEQQLDACRAIGLVLTRFGDPDDAGRAALLGPLNAAYPSADARVNRELCVLLVRLTSPDVVAKTMALFQKAPTQEEQIDYMAALRLANWGWTPPLREKQLRWFLRAEFNKPDNLGKFMVEIRRDSLETLSDAEKVALKPILEAKPEAQPAQPVSSRLFVKHWATDELTAKVAPLLKAPRDTARGQKLFRETGCIACHAFNGNGGAVGPDLSLVGGRFGTREIIESIVEPSKVISDQFATFQVTLNDGTVVLGKLAGESSTMVQIQENLFEPSDVRAIARKDVRKLEQSPISLMPPGLIDTCQPEEIADLVAFLVGGVKQAPAK